MDRQSVHIAHRDGAHPFISTHPTIESVTAAFNLGNKDPKGKSRQVEQEPRAVLHHALKWAVERSDVELSTWLCGLEGDWVRCVLEMRGASG
jgi:hypothetical protein